jgi:hypothetical protein
LKKSDVDITLEQIFENPDTLVGAFPLILHNGSVLMNLGGATNREKDHKVLWVKNTEKRPKQKKVDFDYFTKEKIDEDIVTRTVMQKQNDNVRASRLTDKVINRLRDKYFKVYDGKEVEFMDKWSRTTKFKISYMGPKYVPSYLVNAYNNFIKNGEVEQLKYEPISFLITFEHNLDGSFNSLQHEFTYFPIGDRLDYFDKKEHFTYDFDKVPYLYTNSSIRMLLNFISSARWMLKELFEGTEAEIFFANPSKITKADFQKK